MKLRPKMISMFIIIATLSAAPIAYFGINNTSSQTKTDINSAMTASVSGYANNIEDWLHTNAKIAECTGTIISSHTNGVGFDDSFLMSYKQKSNNGSINDLYVALENGTFVDATGWTPPSDFDARTRDWYKGAKKADGEYFTDPYIDADTKKLLITISYPLKNSSGQFIGVTAEDIFLTSITNKVKDIKYNGSGFAFMCTKDGTILAHPSNDMLDKSMSADKQLATVFSKIKDKNSGDLEYTYDGKKMIMFYQRLPDTGWILCLNTEAATVYAPVNNLITKYIWVCGFILVFAILVALFFSIGISRPISLLNGMMEKAGRGDFTERPNARLKRRRDEIGSLVGSFDNMLANVQEEANYAQRIASGDLNITITEKSDKDILALSMKKVVASLTSLTEEIEKISEATQNGKLNERGDSLQFNGSYRNILDGINNTLDAVVKPLQTCADSFGRISRGDIPPKISLDYHGEFKEIKDSLNTCIDAVNALIDDTSMLADAALSGNLSVRADAQKHHGDFRKIVEGINSTLNAVTGPLNMTAECIAKISRGEIPPKSTDDFKGDFNILKNNLNTCIDSINALIQDTDMLSSAALSGDLSVHADAQRHQGDFKKIIVGINSTLSAVTKPLSMTAECISRISKGDIPQQITEEYKGDFNLLKNNLNTCISSINMLIADADMLSAAALDGNLSIRADATLHQGGFKRIITGVNDTLSALITPVRETAAVLDAMSEGRLNSRVSGSYKGELADMKESINKTLDSISGYISEMSDVLQQVSEGDFSNSINGEYKGDFVVIKQSINNITSSLNNLLGEMLTHVGKSATIVNEGAKQISETSRSLSAAASEQAGSVEELTASVAEISDKASANAQNAAEAKALITSIRSSAETGGTQMNEMLTSIRAISEASKNISKIVKEIDSIAFQTNILALNASVEAARAGIHGKGFAVVAEEVRNLAARSKAAAAETTNLIDNSISKAESGVISADKTAGAFTDISTGVAKAADLISKISAASAEEASGINQIDKGIKSVSQVVQTVAASSEESAASSEELQKEAEILKDQIAKFNLGN